MDSNEGRPAFENEVKQQLTASCLITNSLVLHWVFELLKHKQVDFILNQIKIKYH